MAAHSETLAPKKRLDSWKEIAGFFGRDERTVKRWEKERGLPVYRVPGSARGGVFAYAEELTVWLQSPSLADDAPVEAEENVWSGDARRVVESLTEPIRIAVAAPVPVPVSVPEIQLGNPTRFAAAKPFLWLVPLTLIVGSFLVLSFGHREQRFKNALAAPHVASTEAQDLYLKGRYYFEKRTPEDLNKAVDFFTQAIVHDPGYPAPYVGLADTYNLLREYSEMPAQEAYPRALAAASKAVELDPNSAEAHNSLAFASFWGFFDATTADREFKRAIELDPTLPRAHHWYATFLAEIGRSHEALSEIEKARQLNPSSTPILADKGFILTVDGKKEEARTLLTQLVASQPDFIHPHQYLGDEIYFPEGNYPGYFQEKKIVAKLRHDAVAEKNLEAEEKGYDGGGLPGLLEARLHSAQNAFDRGFGSAFEVADAHAALGEFDDAMKYLDLAYRRHDLNLVTLPLNTNFQSLRQNQEFRNLVAKVGLPPIN